MKDLFAIQLLEALIKHTKDTGITKAITIPYLVKAYKIHERDYSPITKAYIQKIFNDIIDNAQVQFFVAECTDVNNHKVISILNKKDDIDVNEGNGYRLIRNKAGMPIIYFETEFEIQSPTIENISQFFWEKYKDDCFIPCKYSYNNGRWGDISDTELNIIKEL